MKSIQEEFYMSLKNSWKWFVSIGIVMIVLGCLAISYEFLATIFSIYVIATLLVMAGATLVVYSFKLRKITKTLLWAVLGVLYVIAGIISFKSPIQTSAALTLILSFLLIVSGITQSINAITYRGIPRWGWLLFSGIITLILGIMILIEWPISSYWVLGTFLGIDFISQGCSLTYMGFAFKPAKK